MSKKRKRKNYIKNWKRQTNNPMTEKTLLMFGKYRLKTIAEVKEIDPDYYKWIGETFTLTKNHA